MYLRVVLASLVGFFLFFVNAAGAQLGHPVPGVNPMEAQAMNMLGKLIDLHPKEEVRTQFMRWMHDRTIRIAYRSDKLPDSLAIEYALVENTRVPVLVVNPEFMAAPVHVDMKVDFQVKSLTLYHGYTIIKNHLDGIQALRSAELMQGESFEDRARHLWAVQKLAAKAEWDLAKEMDARVLIHDLDLATKQFGEERALVECLYQRFTQRKAMTSQPVEFQKYWDIIYKEEIKNLSQIKA